MRNRQTAPPDPLGLLGLQSSAGNRAVVQYLQDEGAVSRPDDPDELAADRNAEQVMGAGPASAVPAGSVPAGSAQPLPSPVRAFMEPRFGNDFADVRVHTDRVAHDANAALQAEAFTYGRDIYFGAGRSPAADPLTAHELAHVVQQRQSGAGMAAKRIRPSFTASFPVRLGVFEVDMQTRQGALNTPPTLSGFDGYIRFVPGPGAPNSNQIVFVQIVKLTDAAGADAPVATMPAAQSPRGALGQPGLRTDDDAARGVEGGFFTDVHHRPNVGAPGATQGSPLSPRYDFQPTPPGGAPATGLTQQPAQYGGATGGVVGQTPGFKRSEDPADIRSAALYDTPGNPSPAANVNFEFESVAKGEDTMVVYGAVKWGFGLRAGKVVDEHLDTDDSASATFAEALERHRDFYVHEPVTFYFPFDGRVLDATQLAKIDTLLDYLARNPTVRMSIQGFADIKGGVSTYNSVLSLDRAEAVEKALVDKGVDPGRIDDVMVGLGASTSATTDAGTGDQGGDPAVGADQTREANRWANRQVVLTFEQTASTPVGGAGP